MLHITPLFSIDDAYLTGIFQSQGIWRQQTEYEIKHKINWTINFSIRYKPRCSSCITKKDWIEKLCHDDLQGMIKGIKGTWRQQTEI